MELRVLNQKKCAGQKSFFLQSDNVLGYTVTVLKKTGEEVVYNNLSSIEWLFSGGLIILISKIHGGSIYVNALDQFTNVTITEATKIEDSL